MAQTPHKVWLDGEWHHFMLNRVEVVEHRLHDRIEELVDYFSNEKVLEFLHDICRAAYVVKTPTGFVHDDDASANFVMSDAYSELAQALLLDAQNPEDELANFIAATCFNLQHTTHNIFEGNANDDLS